MPVNNERENNNIEDISVYYEVTLAERNCIVIVATHDMELAKALDGTYKCMNFCNYIENGTIVFDYKIHDGYSQTQNAIKLLHHIGFPESITELAEELYNISSNY